MNRLMALVKREFWENKGAFRTTPLVIGGIYIVSMLMVIFTTLHFDNELYSFKEAIHFAAQQSIEHRAKFVEFFMVLMGTVLFSLTLAIVVFFYLLGSLYDDRKDRSILFWKSLPTSDVLTLTSKLLTAMILAPVMFWVFYVLTQIMIAVTGSIMVLSVGENPWTLFLSIGNPFKAWSLVLLSYLAQSIWALPLYGWLMLVSAFAPRIPLLFAILPPVVLGVLELWVDFLKTFTINDNLFGLFGHWFSNSPLILSGSNHGDEFGIALGIPLRSDFDHQVTVANILDRIFSLNMLGGLAVAATFLAAALWLRRRATES